MTELNLSYQKDITPRSLSNILKNQKNLKRLNLTQTQVNDQVLHLIANSCQCLEELSLRDCKSIYDDCLLYLTNILSRKLTSLNVDNVFLTDDCVKQILIECTLLKFLYTDNLVRVINSMTQESNIAYVFNLETIYCDNTNVYMQQPQFNCLTFSCPKLKCIQITCFGSNEILGSLKEFKALNQLIISNQNVVVYKFDNNLVNYFMLNGHQLRKLHLIHVCDVNIQTIIQNCMNLSELVVEFSQYYTPFGITIDYELTELEQKMLPDLKYLNTISMGNFSINEKKTNLNIELFKFDLKLLIKKAINLKNLRFDRFNFINDEFFNDLMKFSFEQNASKIEKIELIKLNQLSMNVINRHLLFHETKVLPIHSENRFKRLKNVYLIDCKLITKVNFEVAIKKLKSFNLDCLLKWS